MNSNYPDIICASATPEGRSALAIVRVSGHGSGGLVERLMKLEDGRLRGKRRKLGIIWNGERPVDQVVAIAWPEGSSYTGEQMVEIMCHGIPAVVGEILDLLKESGARGAEPGEFTRRAFVSGRMTAMEVIALASSMSDGSGGTGRDFERGLPIGPEERCGRILTGIRRARESLEGEIEFQETHDTGPSGGAEESLLLLSRECSDFREYAFSLEKPGRVLIMGPVNSGKSTLFNLLTGGRALVSHEPGTTRDGASGIAEVNGRRVTIVDTAGADGDGLDGEAYRNVLSSLDGDETILWMSVAGRCPVPGELAETCGAILELASKSDLKRTDRLDLQSFSALTGEGMEELREHIAGIPGSLSISGVAERVLRNVEDSLRTYREGDSGMSSEHLLYAEEQMSQVMETGTNISLSVERALSELCVGK